MKIENVDGNREVKMTSIIRRRVRAGCEHEFERWTKDIASACQKFEGYLGTRLIYPTDSSEPHVTILSFDSYQNYRTWFTSDVRKSWLEKAEKCTEGAVSIEELSGFDYWLGSESDRARSWPPSFKMNIAAYLAILPLVSFVLPTIQPFMPGNRVLGTLLSTAVITLLMGYVSLPLVARIFRRWLVAQ
jgi:antibiotic biosynthesis monooxygenase (ABM) superfamily enzyme